MADKQGESCDVFIIGGGISGAAVAAECAQRGLLVQLCDKNDVGGASSSQSDQILPGTMHFLRSHNLPYFNKVSKERKLLIQRAPHLCTDQPFVVVPAGDQAPSLLSRIWLWLFQSWLQSPEQITTFSSRPDPDRLAPLQSPGNHCWQMQETTVDDARLVMENLLFAAQRGAHIRPRHEFVAARQQQGRWQIEIRNRTTGDMIRLHSRCLINAAGARVNQVQQIIANQSSRCWVEHKRKLLLVIPRFYSGDQGYLLEPGPNQISVTPLQNHFCLVATATGVSTHPVPEPPTAEEIQRLLQRLGTYFSTTLPPDAVLRSYSVQQPVYSDTRQSLVDGVDDYALDLSSPDGRSPLISIFGGSFATHRAMAGEIVEMLGQYIPLNEQQIPQPLPGGDMAASGYDQFILRIARDYPWLPGHLLQHYCRTYGARCLELLGNAQSTADLGLQLTPGLFQREARFLVATEWASTAEDILWRRTRLGLYASNEDFQTLAAWMSEHLASPRAAQAYTMSPDSIIQGQSH